MSGTLSALPVLPGQHVQAGDLLAVVEAMKMEHGIVARQAGTVRAIAFTVGDSVKEGQLIVDIAPGTQASL
ncbi:acetyl-CoA carboxylase biotin carboxyl carrier protein subunit [Diaphorobacter aerolatus]|uniref:acetyl-CoA carboxylase biotin carboxyl carrier protein subunit n=1 Tax=Diaphorobacter aerolatus TaxID=1288495 RepID=UPI001D003EA9|nr:acetyl-CoA carboxylase biotin carboxyl carrier protein subunit [Diaphorobacter aerolatus]